MCSSWYAGLELGYFCPSFSCSTCSGPLAPLLSTLPPSSFPVMMNFSAPAEVGQGSTDCGISGRSVQKSFLQAARGTEGLTDRKLYKTKRTASSADVGAEAGSRRGPVTRPGFLGDKRVLKGLLRSPALERTDVEHALEKVDQT